MALVFSPLVRLNGGALAVSVGSGAVSSYTTFQGLKVSDSGAVYVCIDGVIDRYANGLPFDVNGRLVLSTGAPVRVQMSVPFTATGAVSGGEA